MKKIPKYENLAVVARFKEDYKVLAFVSGDSKADILRKLKTDPQVIINVRNQGLIWVAHPDFPRAINSNKL